MYYFRPQVERMKLCSELWAGGVRAEFGYKPNPNFKQDIIGAAADQGELPAFSTRSILLGRLLSLFAFRVGMHVAAQICCCFAQQAMRSPSICTMVYHLMKAGSG